MAIAAKNPPAPATVKGNAEGGREPYVTCAACHGPKGQGIQATNAPQLKGMSDWYMLTQLNNFRHGIRGTDGKDTYGAQMANIAGMLNSDQAAADVVAYINTLK